MKRIAVITARSGSKGLKDKNILPICGKPLLAHSVEAAVQSGLFDRVILSTDSEEYGSIGVEYGAEFIKRSEKNAGDAAPTFAVLEELFASIGTDFDYFVLLQPTSPMRNATHVKEACRLFEERMQDFDFLVSMCPSHLPSVLVRPIEEDTSLKYFDTDFSNYRRQGARDYSPNGALYIAKPEAYLRQKHFYGARATSYVMDAYSSVDVDDLIDYEFAKLLMEKREKGLL